MLSIFVDDPVKIHMLKALAPAWSRSGIPKHSIRKDMFLENKKREMRNDKQEMRSEKRNEK